MCQANWLKMSVWVDDLNISGASVSGDLVEQIRDVIRKRGFKTHKIEFRMWTRPVIVTGVPIIRHRVMAPRPLHKRIQDGYALLRQNLSDTERAQGIDRLLSALGSHRYHVGSATDEGRKTSNRMEGLRQRRVKLKIRAVTLPDPEKITVLRTSSDPLSAPWD